MTEEFLQYVWKFGLFDQHQLQTEQGEAVTIIRPGDLNPDAGPDFFNGRVRIGETEWAGNIEIHRRSTDWDRHGHEGDPAYDNVVLHVVGMHDGEVKTGSGRELPTLSIGPLIPTAMWGRYQQLVVSKHWIPCERKIAGVDPFLVQSWVGHLVIERLERKSKSIELLLQETSNDWTECFYIALARSFGFKVNSPPFEHLAHILPFRQMAKHRNNPLQVEALLYGQAGMLEGEFKDEYPNQLKKEYQFLRHKLQLEPMFASSWKFMRLRPSNFPTIRIAQFAQLVLKWDALYSRVMESKSIGGLEELCRVEASGYWLDHYQFDKSTRKSTKRMGNPAIQTLLINTVAPFLFVYGRQKGLPAFEERAAQLLDNLPGEQNTIIRGWEKLGIEAPHAFHSQGLLELKNEYCNRKNCLNCVIGNQILRNPND